MDNFDLERPEWFSWSSFNLQDSNRLQAVSLLVSHNPRWLHFLFDYQSPQLRVSANDLLVEAEEFSFGEECLIRAAITLWGAKGDFDLSAALLTWNEEHLVGFVRAICHLNEIRNPVMHALIDDENGGFCL